MITLDFCKLLNNIWVQTDHLNFALVEQLEFQNFNFWNEQFLNVPYEFNGSDVSIAKVLDNHSLSQNQQEHSDPTICYWLCQQCGQLLHSTQVTKR